ncbi:MAG TPA: hypothetical protein VGO71_12990 [Baekduia sp.]|nr:hypothetical protein [Baekduia sp.]
MSVALDHGGDRTRRERTGAAPCAAPEQHEHAAPPQQRRHDERQRVAGESIEDQPRVVVQHDEAGGRERARDERGDLRARAEVAREVGRTGAPA